MNYPPNRYGTRKVMKHDQGPRTNQDFTRRGSFDQRGRNYQGNSYRSNSYNGHHDGSNHRGTSRSNNNGALNRGFGGFAQDYDSRELKPETEYPRAEPQGHRRKPDNGYTPRPRTGDSSRDDRYRRYSRGTIDDRGSRRSPAPPNDRGDQSPRDKSNYPESDENHQKQHANDYYHSNNPHDHNYNSNDHNHDNSNTDHVVFTNPSYHPQPVHHASGAGRHFSRSTHRKTSYRSKWSNTSIALKNQASLNMAAGWEADVKLRTTDSCRVGNLKLGDVFSCAHHTAYTRPTMKEDPNVAHAGEFGAVHSKFRKMIVVHHFERQTLAVPIYTYMNKGSVQMPPKEQAEHVPIRDMNKVEWRDEGLGDYVLFAMKNASWPHEFIRAPSLVHFTEQVSLSHGLMCTFEGVLVDSELERLRGLMRKAADWLN